MIGTHATRRAILVGLLVVLLAGSQIQATFFLLGGGCVVVLDSALALVGGQLDQLGLGDALETIRDFCTNFIRYSLEGVAMGTAEVQLRNLLRFIRRAGLDLPNRLPELAELVRQLADTLREVNMQLGIDDN